MPIDLFAPFCLNTLEIPNRIMRSATWDGTADSSGAVTEQSLAIYRKLARGAIGLIVTGYTYVSRAGKSAPGQYGIYADDLLSGLRQLVDEVHQCDGKVAVQIQHGGINARGENMLASVVSRLAKFDKPQQEMTEADIECVICDFVAAAVRAREAGFDAVQLHGAHGYLFSQFLSPAFNKRTDRWGGSIENRSRFPIEVIRRVRLALGNDYPLLIKFGVQDEIEDGLKLADGVTVARWMVEAGIDAIEISTGVSGSIRRTIPLAKSGEPERAVFRERAATVKRAVDIPVALVGGIRSKRLATEIIDSGDADIISMCRPFVREPDLLLKWQRTDQALAKCISCGQCLPRQNPRGILECGQELCLREGIASV